MMKTSKKLIRKKTCNYLVGLFSSAKSIATKGKLHLSVISYTYPQLVTLLLKNSKHANFINTTTKAFKNESYISSTFSYTLPTISYTYPSKKSTATTVKTKVPLKLLQNYIKISKTLEVIYEH